MFSLPSTRQRKIFLALAIFSAFVTIITPILGRMYHVHSVASATVNSEIPSSERASLVKVEAAQGSRNSGDSQINQPPKRSAADVAVVNSWFDTVGYSPEKKETYRTYSDAVLMDLVKNGDVIAMNVQEEKALNAGNIPEAKHFAELAVTYGSLRSIKSMANYYMPYGNSFELSEAKARFEESLAYIGLLSFRGDPYSAKLFKETWMDQFKDTYNLQSVLTADDEKWISNRTEELYAKYQADRLKLGLGEFDNHTPKEVKEFFEGK